LLFFVFLPSGVAGTLTSADINAPDTTTNAGTIAGAVVGSVLGCLLLVSVSVVVIVIAVAVKKRKKDIPVSKAETYDNSTDLVEMGESKLQEAAPATEDLEAVTHYVDNVTDVNQQDVHESEPELSIQNVQLDEKVQADELLESNEEQVEHENVSVTEHDVAEQSDIIDV
jgi:hypothetical protein